MPSEIVTETRFCMDGSPCSFLFGALQKGVGRIYSINQLADNPFRRKASMFNQQLLTGRRILVTGGGTGLGKSMAARFLELGAEVHICGRRKSVFDETATELMDLYGRRVMIHDVGISNPLSGARKIDAIFIRRPLTH